MTEIPLAAANSAGRSDGGEAPASELPATTSQRRDDAILTETSSGYEP